jgi:two-component system OmpR family response regulator
MGNEGKRTAMRILLIEDDTVLGAAVRDQISGDGQSLDWVTRLDAAGDAIAGAAYDLVLLDLMLPGVDGLEVARRVRTFSDAYILMLTAKTDEVDRIVGLQVGADDYLTKPFELDDLQRTV